MKVEVVKSLLPSIFIFESTQNTEKKKEKMNAKVYKKPILSQQALSEKKSNLCIH